MRRFSGVSRFPIGFWNYMTMKEWDERALADWEACAFSTIQSPAYSLDEEDRNKLAVLLAWCEKQNVKVILRDPRVSILWIRDLPRDEKGDRSLPYDYERGVVEAVAEFAHHPQVAGFFIIDEPERDLYEVVVQAVGLIKAHAAHLLPFVNFFPAIPQTMELLGYRDYGRYLEDYVQRTGAKLVSYDYYGQMTEREYENPLYYTNLSHYRNLALRGIDFWNTILSTPHFRYRKPSYDDVRWQVNTSLAYGAKGIFYFTFYTPDNTFNSETNYRQGPIDWWGERTDTFFHMRDVNRELHQRWGSLFMDLQLLRVGHYPEAPADGGQLLDFGCAIKEIAVEAGHDPHLIVSEFRHRISGQTYAFIVNANPRDSVNVQVYMQDVRQLQRFNAYGEAYVVNNQAKFVDEFSSLLWLAPGQGELMALERVE